MKPQNYTYRCCLSDGTILHLRAIRSSDKTQLREGFRKLSLDSIYARFLQVKSDLSTQELAYFTEIDFSNHVALVATIPTAQSEHLVVVGRYIITASEVTGKQAEMALIVADAYQGRGIGTLLFQHLVSLARAGGVTVLEAELLAQNHRMLNIVQKSGYHVARSHDQGVIHITIDLTVQHTSECTLDTCVEQVLAGLESKSDASSRKQRVL